MNNVNDVIELLRDIITDWPGIYMIANGQARKIERAIALLEGMGGQFVPQDSGVKRYADGTQEVWATGPNPHPPTQTAAVKCMNPDCRIEMTANTDCCLCETCSAAYEASTAPPAQTAEVPVFYYNTKTAGSSFGLPFEKSFLPAEQIDEEDNSDWFTLPLYTAPPTKAAVPDGWKDIAIEAIKRMRAGHVACMDIIHKADKLLDVAPAPVEKQSRTQIPEGVTSVRNAVTGESVSVEKGIKQLDREKLLTELKERPDRERMNWSRMELCVALAEEVEAGPVGINT